MSEYIIKGGNRIEGVVEISGSKNASLPIIAATILHKGKTTLYNVPNIHDTKIMFKILEELGAKVVKKNKKTGFAPNRTHSERSTYDRNSSVITTLEFLVGAGGLRKPRC